MDQHQLRQLHQRQRQQASLSPHAAAQVNTHIDLTLNDDHNAAMQATEKHASEEKTIRDHNRRISIMIKWIEINYPNYFQTMVVTLTEAQKSDKLKYYKATHDFVYSSLHVSIIKAFISAHKIRGTSSNGQPIYYGYDHLRKYKDAVLFGSKRVNSPLPHEYTLAMKTFLDSLKKENQKKKKLGQVTEQEADAITFPLYIEICKNAVMNGCIFLWVFTVFQWNCMARSINIDNLRFNCFSIGKDSIVVKYWDTKKDKKGDKTSPKNCFANPLNFFICCHTALGVYLCLNDETFNSGKQTLFLTQGAQEGTASHKYCKALVMLFNRIKEKVAEYIRPGHANAHGMRKGSAVEATSGTTCPPPTSSVARRGEWSLGKVFDIYWLFASAGDFFLGRILAGLDPNSAKFEVLPPHFTVGLENEFVKNSMQRCFPNIMINLDEATRTNFIGVLLRCLASIVHHSDELMKVIQKNPGHPFSQVPILNQPHLLSQLKPLVTINPSSKINAPTGIPPHVRLMSSIADLVEMVREERNERVNLEEKLVNAVENSIENNAISNGNITHHSVSKILQTHQKQMTDSLAAQNASIEMKMGQLLACVQGNAPSPFANVGTTSESVSHSVNANNNCVHQWDGRFWHVPKGFFISDRVSEEEGVGALADWTASLQDRKWRSCPSHAFSTHESETATN